MQDIKICGLNGGIVAVCGSMVVYATIAVCAVVGMRYAGIYSWLVRAENDIRNPCFAQTFQIRSTNTV